MDSVAGLLFEIKANPDEAIGNIQRFRALFTSDMGAMRTQMGEFATRMFGSSKQIRAAYDQEIAAIEAKRAAMVKAATTAEETAAAEVQAAHRVAAAQANLQKSLKGTGTGWVALGAVVAGAVVAVGAGLFEMAKKSAELGEHLELMHQKIGLSVQDLSGLRVVAGMIGANFEQLANGVAIMDRNLSPFATAGSTATKALAALGIQANDAHGKLRPNIDLLADMADKFHGAASSGLKTAAAMAVFGRSGKEMIPILNQGSVALRKASEEANKMGLGFSDVSAKQSVAFLESMRRIKFTMEGLEVTIGQKVMPAITAAMQSAADFIASHAADISTAIEGLGYVFNGLTFVAKAAFDVLVTIGKLLAGELNEFVLGYQLVSDLRRGDLTSAKAHWAAMKAVATETWTDIVSTYAEGTKGSTAALESLGRATELHLTGKSKAAAVASDKLADSLRRVSEEITLLHDQTAKPEAAVERQFERETAAANREIESYRKLAAHGKLTRAELAQREREYHQLVIALAEEREAKLKDLNDKRLDSLSALDEEMANKIDAASVVSHARKVAAIDREIESERKKYQKLDALDAAHNQMLVELREKLIKRLAEEEKGAADKKAAEFDGHLKKLQDMTNRYLESSLTGKAKIHQAMLQEIADIQMETAQLTKMATTDEQRARIATLASQAVAAAHAKETRALDVLATKHNEFTASWQKNYDSMIQASDLFGSRFATVAHRILGAINQQILAHQKEAVSAVATEKAKSAGVIGALKETSFFQIKVQIAEAMKSFASGDFLGGAEHTAAAVLFGIAAGQQVAGMFSGGGGGGRGSSGGSQRQQPAPRAATTGGAGGGVKAGSGQQQPATSGTTIHVYGDMVSADTIDKLIDLFNQSTGNRGMQLNATHVYQNGSPVAVMG